MSIARFLEEIIFPGRCVVCKKDGALICGACLLGFPEAENSCSFCPRPTLDSRTCSACAKHTTLARAFAVFDYEHIGVAKVIQSLKYNGWFSLMHDLQHSIEDKIERESTALSTADVVISAPIRTQSFLERGFNQADCISRVVSTYLHIPHVRALKFTYVDAPQHKKDKQTRWKNVHGRIKATRLAKGIKHAIVVDDLLTSGATLESCAWALSQQGVQEISGFTLARQKKFFR